MNQASPKTGTPEPLKFRLSFVALPLIVLLLVVALSAIYYGQLPEQVYYRFDTSGDPSGNPIAKASFIMLMAGIQAALFIAAYIATMAIGKVKLFQDNVGNFWFSPTRLLTLMGNMPAIIQLIMAYVLVDAIVYAQNASHLMPLWLFAVIVLITGGILILIFGLPIVIKAYKGFMSIEEKKKE